MNERRNVPEIVIAIPRIASQIPNSDQSPLYDVRNPARPSDKDATCEVMFRGRLLWLDSRAVFAVSSYAGHFDRLYPAAPRIAEGEAWWSQTGSNRRPHACKARALPAELWPHFLRRRPSSPFGLCRARFTPLSCVAAPRVADGEAWWAWEDLNFRPHAYQARALTN
jgi:hypothetical protein